MIRVTVKLVLIIIALITASLSAQEAIPKEAAGDRVLRAMLTEMQRSKAQLKLEGVAAPYYIDYRITDSDRYWYEAAYGAARGYLDAAQVSYNNPDWLGWPPGEFAVC